MTTIDEHRTRADADAGPRPAGRPRVALVSYSTKPRGGVVHTLSLAESMVAEGMDVELVSLGDRDHGYFRPVAAPFRLIASPTSGPTLEERVFASIDVLEQGLTDLADRYDIVHTQDCISARAAARVRDAGACFTVVRTVHHIDDFTTQALIDCQHRAVLEPDDLVVVSRDWQQRLRADYGVDSTVIHNGVDADRFPPIDPARRAALLAEHGLTGRFVFLAVGGIEPRKGSTFLTDAMSRLVREMTPAPALVVIGGHSFQDYRAYREDVLGRLKDQGLEVGRDIILAGTVSQERLHEWYRSADALAFPSVKEGWGLAVLEALSADLPVVASDIAVLREYLTDGQTALLTRTGDAADLAAGMRRLVHGSDLRETLVEGGRRLVPEYSWRRAAVRHGELYAESMARRSLS